MNIGIIGAGQLGRMLALAGYPLGLRFMFLDKSADAPGGQVGSIIIGEFANEARLEELARCVDVVTFDVENVPEEAIVRAVTGHARFLPPLPALAAAQDRLREKRLFGELGIPTPAHRPVDTLDELRQATAELGFPAVLKTRRLGYDGRGQRVLADDNDLAPAWDALGRVPMIVESFVSWEQEVSIIGVRSVTGATAFYPMSRNIHERGILRYSVAPLEDDTMQAEAEAHLARLLEHLEYAGVLTIEFFVVQRQLLANEIAPRVHNSGHWTIEGAVTSQFENHIRGILGLPLGDTSPIGQAAMVNFLGHLPRLDQVLGIPGAHFHSYGKAPRPRRKLGHCTICTTSGHTRDEGLAQLLELADQCERNDATAAVGAAPHG